MLLAASLLAASPWLLDRPGLPDGGRQPPSAALPQYGFVPAAPEDRSTIDAARPELLSLGDTLRPLPASGEHSGAVVPAEFPDPDELLAPAPDSDGPTLAVPDPTGTALPAPKTSSPAVGVGEVRIVPPAAAEDPATSQAESAPELPQPEYRAPVATGEPPSTPVRLSPELQQGPVQPGDTGAPSGFEIGSSRPEASLLLPPEAGTQRSEQLERVARQADRQIRAGFDLAGRKAYFAARAQFVAALRLLVQGLDAEHQTTMHSQALSAGLTAMGEAEDFLPGAPQLESERGLEAIIGRHRTPVLKQAAAEDLTPLTALRCYLTFAQEQLAAGAGREVAGSMALHALGKLYKAIAEEQVREIKAAEAKAVVCFQAALLVCPQNYLAANDLGVLLARGGNLEDAKAVLEHSVLTCPQSTVWHNLAVVYEQLGRGDSARRAAWQARLAERTEIARRGGATGGATPRVQWVDPQTFAQAGGDQPIAPQVASASRTPQLPPQPEKPAASHGWQFPWSTRSE
jgi:tetratricopeptide (TPR) repeat protein